MSSMLQRLKRSRTLNKLKSSGGVPAASLPPIVECTTPVDVAASSMPVHTVEYRQFFGHDPLASEPLPAGSRLAPEVYTTPLPLPLNAFETLPEPTYDVLTFLTWVVQAVPGEESTLTDLLGPMLKGVGIVPDNFVVRVPKQFELRANSMVIGCAEADLALQSVEGLVTLVAKVAMPGVEERELETQLIKTAITCFHSNNTIREKLGLDKLETMDVPALTLIGTTLMFYLIPVTETTGLPPSPPPTTSKSKVKSSKESTKLAVAKCQPVPLGCPGMEDVHTRRATFAYLTAFQTQTKSACRKLRAGL